MLKKIAAICLVLMAFILAGCSIGDDGSKPKINDAYLSCIAGKTFQASEGQCITFYEDGYATYDYDGAFGHHYYRYVVRVTNSTATQIDFTLEEVYVDSEDYEDNGPQPATYYINDNYLFYYQPYTCLVDSVQVLDFSNAYGTFTTICAQEGCVRYIAPSGNTMYCPEHTGACEFCRIFINPGSRFCPNCPYCIFCGVIIAPDSGYRCSNCINRNKNPGKKCSLCNGTGMVKYYYGDSDLQAYLDGHEASWYGQCGSCGGSGYEK